jgi:hypothetical protein
MKSPVLSILPLLVLAVIGCAKDDAVTSAGVKLIYADQRFYPVERGSFWSYRIDTIGTDNIWVRDVERKIVHMGGMMRLDTTEYTVQINETQAGVDVSFDTVYVRKSHDGAFFTSAALRGFSALSGLPNLPSFPKELMLIPYPLESTQQWSILNFEYNQIPLFPIYFRVSATNMGIETVIADNKTFRNCTRILVQISARLPNLENPADYMNPTIINENASFWLSRPLGLVMGDGSSLVFALINGQLPLTAQRRRIHQELLNFDVVQPDDPCVGRGTGY